MEQLLWGSPDDIAPYLPLSGYVYLGLVGVAYFCVQHAVLHALLGMVYPRYKEMNSHDFHEYRMQINALIHGCLSTSFALYCTIWTCQNGKTFFNDEQCRLVPRNSHVWTCFFTAGYLFVESVFILGYVGLETPLDKQALVHHALGFANFYIAFWQ